MFEQKLLKKYTEKTEIVLSEYMKKFVNKDLLRYKKREAHLSLKKIKKVQEIEIIRNLYNAKIIIFGEFHYSTLPKKSIRKYIKKYLDFAVKKEKKDILDVTQKLVLAIEAIRVEHQTYLDDYIFGKISYEDFIAKIKFDKNWGVNSSYYYKSLFEFARDYKIKMLAIDVDPQRVKNTLELRDKTMAETILEKLRTEPQSKIFVVVGDWHATTNHLACELKKQIEKDSEHYSADIIQKIYSFYLNYDQLWEYKLKHKIINHRWFKLDDKIYSISDTIPYVKQFSTQDESKLLINIKDNEEKEEDSVLEIFNGIVKDLSEILELNIADKNYWDSKVEIFIPSEREILIERLIKEQKETEFITLNKIKEFMVYITKFGSCFIPVSLNKNYIYVSNTSTPNQYAQMATRYLRDMYIDKKKKTENALDRFYLKIIDEGLRFLGNKLINPFVECNEYEKHFEVVLNIERKKELDYSKNDILTSKLFIKIIDAEKKSNLTEDFINNFVIKNIIKKPDKINFEVYVGLIRSLGRTLGRELYYNLGEFKDKESIRKAHDTLLKDYSPCAFNWYNKLKGPLPIL
jgi:uncharacterized iron-regulated protein